MAACIHHSSTTEANQPSQCQSGTLLCRCVISCRPIFLNLVFCNPVYQVTTKNPENFEEEDDHLWFRIRHEALSDIEQEPLLSNYYHSLILSHNSLETALSNLLAMKLSNSNMSTEKLFEIFSTLIRDDLKIKKAIRCDLEGARQRDPACTSYIHCFLNFKGFQAIQAHKVAHKLWSKGGSTMARVIQGRVLEVFGVDIHPGAKIGQGVLLDHATGVVIGETAVIEDNVTIMHNVTLGSRGSVDFGERHPKIGNWVILGAGAKVLGNIRVGEKAKIGAGSVVLKEVPPNSTAVGNPARIISGKDKVSQ
ncbi:serine acetyltransferase 1, chloroplastic-like [Carica papaya]|uniref:serine acetyltransferase 1, chloroplastic-like n=1 Tax=Carica papaya TaxID=3649 RepID=UPI000B8CCD71|nr:serine acetyltransferase 1, chloroplastic-like [Carica papaya]